MREDFMKLLLLSLALLALENTVAQECITENAPQNTLKCNGNFRARSHKDLAKYQAELVKLSKKNKAKSLTIDFNLISSEDINIESPCSLRVTHKKKIESPKNVCLRARDNIIIDHSSSLNSADFTLVANKRLAIRKGAKINVSNLLLNSLGNTFESRAHIRHSSRVSANNIALNAAGLATLGHSSFYDVKENITVHSRHSEARLYHRTRYITGKLALEGLSKVALANRISLVADKFIASAQNCYISKKALLEVNSFMGSCYPVVSHNPKVIVSADKTEGRAPLTINFDLSQSFDEDDDISHFEWDFGDGETLSSADLQISHTFNQEGTFTVVVRAIDSLGNIGSDDIEITVHVAKSPEIIYSVSQVPDRPYERIIDMRSSYDPDGQIVRYNFDFGNGQQYSSPFVGAVRHGYTGPGVYLVTLEVIDNEGNSSVAQFELVID